MFGPNSQSGIPCAWPPWFLKLRAAGETVLDEDLARISPLAYSHVILNGTYQFPQVAQV
jgi:hypothetical protein